MTRTLNFDEHVFGVETGVQHFRRGARHLRLESHLAVFVRVDVTLRRGNLCSLYQRREHKRSHF